MFIPKGAVSLKDAPMPKLMVGIMGPPKTGKTTSSLTFPNPVVASFSSSELTGHVGSDILELKFYDKAWVKSNCGGNTNARDGYKYWLTTEAHKLSVEQTLVTDTWTTLQDAFDIQTDTEPVYTKSGQIDDFAFWARKIDYSREIMNLLISLPCNVVVNFHETAMRDASGNLTSKIMPLMQGKFVDKLQSYFSDWFRMIAKEKKQKGADGKDVVMGTEYFWQVKPDNLANCSTRMSGLPPNQYLVPATYEFLKARYTEQYKKQQG